MLVHSWSHTMETLAEAAAAAATTTMELSLLLLVLPTPRDAFNVFPGISEGENSPWLITKVWVANRSVPMVTG